MDRRPRDEYQFGLASKLAGPLRGSIAAPLVGTRNRSSFVGPLDYRPGGVGVAGTIKFYSAYTGKALRVRNPDTNVESDISFNSAGRLDATEIATAKGASLTLPVVKLYVQDGTSNDYVQATANRQPLLTQNGPGGEWCVEFDGSNDFIVATLSLALPYTRYGIWNPLTWQASEGVFDGAQFQASLYALPSPEDRYGAGSFQLAVADFPDATWSISTDRHISGGAILRRNKGTAGTSGQTSSAMTHSTVAAFGGGGSNYSNIGLVGVLLYGANDDTTAQDAVIDALAAATGIAV